jgi:acetolactate synthase-1/2/3 large subunit
VITTLHGVGNFDEDHPLSLKMCGMHGLPPANLAIQNSDLIIGIGYRFDDRTVCNLKRYAPTAMANNAIFHIDNSIEKIRKVNELIPTITSINIDSGKFFDIINRRYISPEMDRDIYLNFINKMKREFSPSRYIQDNSLKIPNILNKFSTILNENNLIKIMKSGLEYMDQSNNKIYITTGVGSHQMYAAQHITYKRPNTLLTSGSLGVMGTGLPFAIGASFANPKASVFCIDGDGSFIMSMQELATIREYNLPIKIMIMDNNNLGMIKMWQEMFYDNNVYGSELKNPDFCLLAESFGIRAVYCSEPKHILPVLKELVKYDGPMLVHFKVEDERCLPFVPTNLGLDQMYL